MRHCPRGRAAVSRRRSRPEALLRKKNSQPRGQAECQLIKTTTATSPPELLFLPKPRITWQCWLNPWADLAVLIPPAELSQRVFSYTQLWGVLSTLMCTASVTTLLGFPHAPDLQQLQHMNDCDTTANDKKKHELPLLAIVIPETKLHDFYIATSLLSFFCGGIALGVATVTNITGFLVPSEFLGLFVARHSLFLGSLPGLTVLSGGLLGMSVVSGVDMEDRGGTLSKLAVSSYIISSVFIGATSISGHSALVRGIARAKRRLKPC